MKIYHYFTARASCEGMFLSHSWRCHRLVQTLALNGCYWSLRKRRGGVGSELIREESAESCERQGGEEGGRDTAASVNGCPSETQRAFTGAACAPRKLLKSFISCFWDGRCYTVTIYCYKEPVMLTRPWIVLVNDSRWDKTRLESFVTDCLSYFLDDMNYCWKMREKILLLTLWHIEAKSQGAWCVNSTKYKASSLLFC